MRFCDFFIEYKIGLKDIKNLIPWAKLPLYRKISVVITFISATCIIIFGLLEIKLGVGIAMSNTLILMVIFSIIDASKKNLREMLDNHYSIYSKSRMLMLKNIFNKYNLNISDIDTINLLIVQAELAKAKNNPFLPIIKPLKTIGAIIIPVVVYLTKKITENSSQNELIDLLLISIALTLCVASIIISLLPIIKDLFYRDSNKYDELIYDLNQLKIFYK